MIPDNKLTSLMLDIETQLIQIELISNVPIDDHLENISKIAISSRRPYLEIIKEYRRGLFHGESGPLKPEDFKSLMEQNIG